MREKLHSAFAARFATSDPPPRAIDRLDIQCAEQKLGIYLPVSYKQFAMGFGALWTPQILEAIPESYSTECWALQQILAGPEIVQASEMYWSGGMSSELIGFASDCMGNLFCFHRSDIITTQTDDCPVWFFDHDFCSSHQLAPSFDAFLDSYLHLPPSDQPSA